MKICKIFCLVCLLTSFSVTAFASKYELNLSAAKGSANTGVLVLGVKRNYNPWLTRGNFSIVPSVGINSFLFMSNSYSEVYGINLVGGLTFNLSPKVYLFASSGPAYISNDFIAKRWTNSNFHFSTTAALGFNLDRKMKHGLEIFVTHFSHAHIKGKYNDGYNLYGLAYKYRI